MNDLEKYFFEKSELPIHKWRHYFEIYEKYFSKFRSTPIKMLEIGVQNGGSARMWKHYFHPDSLIVGVDIDPNCKQHETSGIDIHIGDQSDVNFLNTLILKYNKFDIILDDGSHVSEHQLASLYHMFPHLNEGGIYFVEDVHSSYWEKKDKPYERSFVHTSKNFIEEINVYFDIFVKRNVSYLSDHLFGIYYHDSIVVLEKKQRKYTPYELTCHKGQIIHQTDYVNLC